MCIVCLLSGANTITLMITLLEMKGVLPDRLCYSSNRDTKHIKFYNTWLYFNDNLVIDEKVSFQDGLYHSSNRDRKHITVCYRTLPYLCLGLHHS